MKVFVTGTYRSGTTILAYMINAAGIPLKEETVNFMRFCYGRYGHDRISKEKAIELGKDLANRLKQRFKLEFDFEQYKKIVLEYDKNISYAYLYGTIMKLFEGTEDWGEKTVLEWRNADKILEMFEDMKIIHIIRDPRDVLASWKKVTIAPGKDYLDCIANCFDSMLYALENRKKFGDRYLVVKYEDLVQDAKTEMKKLCEILEIPFQNHILDVASYKSKLEDKKWDPNVQSGFDDNIEGISTIPIGRWETYLLEEDIYLCELVNGELMEEFGYELSDRKWNIRHFFKVLENIHQSPLTYNGLTSIAHYNQGVQRYALDPLDSSTWGDVEQ